MPLFRFGHGIRAAVMLLALSGLVTTSAWAQNVRDAARLADYGQFGSARSMGMGGAFTALGADYASATVNPAGLALYRSSELQISPALRLVNTSGSLLGAEEDESTTTLSIPSASMVFAGQNNDEDASITSWAFALGVTQVANFHREMEVTGFNPTNSFSTWVANRSDGINPQELDVGSNQFPAPNDFEALAFSTFFQVEFPDGTVSELGVTNPAAGSGNQFFGAFDEGQVAQTVEQEIQGRHNQWNLSLAGNFGNRFMLGGTLFINDINTEFEQTIIEDDVNNVYNTKPDNNVSIPFLDTVGVQSITFNQFFETSGVGVGLRLGMLFLPTDNLKLGLSIETPTKMFLEDDFGSSMSIQDDFQGTASLQTAEGNFEYEYRSPFRLNTGASILISKKGILSADFSLVDYSIAEFQEKDDAQGDIFGPVNNAIDDLLDLSWSVRVGGELRFDDVLYGRAGAGYEKTKWAEEGEEFAVVGTGGPTASESLDAYHFSLGFGYRLPQGFFFDVAVVNRFTQGLEQTYGGFGVTGPTVHNERSQTNAVFTVGTKFGS